MKNTQMMINKPLIFCLSRRFFGLFFFILFGFLHSQLYVDSKATFYTNTDVKVYTINVLDSISINRIEKSIYVLANAQVYGWDNIQKSNPINYSEKVIAKKSIKTNRTKETRTAKNSASHIKKYKSHELFTVWKNTNSKSSIFNSNSNSLIAVTSNVQIIKLLIINEDSNYFIPIPKGRNTKMITNYNSQPDTGFYFKYRLRPPPIAIV